VVLRGEQRVVISDTTDLTDLPQKLGYVLMCVLIGAERSRAERLVILSGA
jgi:hypothetical protein